MKEHIYLIGFQKSGGAQFSLLREAIKRAKENKNENIYFICSGDSSTLIQDKLEDNINIIEHKSRFDFGFFRLFLYSIFLFKKLNHIKSKRKDLYVHYTTPVISLIATTFSFLIGIKYRRYRVGGLLVSLDYRYLSDFLFSIFGYIMDFYITLFSTHITFVSHSNRFTYCRLFPHIRSRKSSVYYSPCCDSNLIQNQNKNTIENNNNKTDFSEYIPKADKIIVLTMVNDKFRKGSPIFYNLANHLKSKKDILFIHVGSRSIKKPVYKEENLLIIPHVSNLSNWIKCSTLTVLFSSYPEGLAQVVPQSLVYSKPVLSFYNSGINDCLIHDFNGYILPVNSNIKMIAKNLLEMISTEKLIDLTKNAKSISEFILKRHSIKK